MLILSRKQNEQIMIREDIVVTVISISGNQVRLGVEAPRQIPVNRQEVLHTEKEKTAGKSRSSAANGHQRAVPGEVQLPLPFPED